MLTIINSSIIATTMMTLFSYIYSELKEEKFKEPQLINILINRLPKISLSIGKSNLLGWIIHYLIGFVFTCLFFIIWEFTVLSPSWLNGSILGFIAGITGILSWKIVFYLHPKPPSIEFSHFYFQLLIAHIIFGASSVGYLKFLT